MRRNQLGQRAGPVREKERADWAAGRECWAGWVEREEKNGPWGKSGLGCFGFGSSFHFYFFFFCKLTQTSLNSNKFEFKLPSTQPK